MLNFFKEDDHQVCPLKQTQYTQKVRNILKIQTEVQTSNPAILVFGLVFAYSCELLIKEEKLTKSLYMGILLFWI